MIVRQARQAAANKKDQFSAGNTVATPQNAPIRRNSSKPAVFVV
jgi:hypothetical protein